MDYGNLFVFLCMSSEYIVPPESFYLFFFVDVINDSTTACQTSFQPGPYEGYLSLKVFVILHSARGLNP